MGEGEVPDLHLDLLIIHGAGLAKLQLLYQLH